MANRVRAGEAPDLVASRNFDDLASILSDAFGVIEKDSGSVSKLLTSLSRAQTRAAQVPLTLTSGTYTLDGSYSDVFCDCSAGNIALTFPSAVGFFGKIIRAYKTDTSTNTLTVNGTVLGGNSGNSVIIWQSNNVAWKLTQLYDEGTFTATLTGFATGPTQTVYFARNGKSVTMKYASFIGTSNATTMTVTGVPSYLYPATTAVSFPAPVRDNGLDYVGSCSISTAGVWTVFYQNTISTNTNVFTNPGTKGLVSNNFAYSMQ